MQYIQVDRAGINVKDINENIFVTSSANILKMFFPTCHCNDNVFLSAFIPVSFSLQPNAFFCLV